MPLGKSGFDNYVSVSSFDAFFAFFSSFSTFFFVGTSDTNFSFVRLLSIFKKPKFVKIFKYTLKFGKFCVILFHVPTECARCVLGNYKFTNKRNKERIMKQTKNAIISSLLILVLCLSTLIGTTFAWFTDAATSKGNIIQSGNLDAEMYWANDLLNADSDQWTDASGSAVFTNNNWEPGYTDVKYIKVANEGNLNLKWKLTIEANGAVSSLSDVISVYYINPVTAKVTSVDGLTSAGTLTAVMSESVNTTGSLVPNESVVLAIALSMDENADNDYQDMSLCDKGFSLKLVATQEVGEFDSFGDKYDENATWFNGTNFSATTSLAGVEMLYGALVNDVTIGDSKVSATVPADVKIADGASDLKLSVVNVENDANLVLGEGEDAKSLDVHISGIASNNTVPMIVNLGPVLQPGISDTALKFYHIENDTPVLMTRVASASDFAIHNQYTYNSTTGEVSIYVASFSVFSLVQTFADVWDGTSDTSWYNENSSEFTLNTAEQFAGFRDLVDGGNSFEGKTVKLGISIDLNNILFDPIGKGYAHLDGQVFKGDFDGQGHVIYNLYQQGWDLDPDKINYSNYTYSTAGGGLFASIMNSTIKNLAVSGADIVFECIDMGIVVGYAQGTCHFENIVVTDSKIANYNRATGAVVGEVCFGPYGTDTSNGYSHTFKNITVDSSVVVSSLWGSFDTSCGGVIGAKWGDATVKMENVTTAARLDVFSDVTAAYQWYAYRRCGMLIGHTEQNSPKKALNAAAPFLTCENVKVYYGDWVNYTYYQFNGQTDKDGNSLWYSNYPWVRAEAGENNGAFSNARYGNPIINGVAINTPELAKANSTDYTPIIFNQLYGGGQGVYGCADHAGVTIEYTTTKTVYIYNDQNWTDLKLYYWFKHDTDEWSTIVEGISLNDMQVTGGVYKVDLPAYADGFQIVGNEGEGAKILVSNIDSTVTYNLDGTIFGGDSSGGSGGGDNTETPGEDNEVDEWE